MAVAASAAHAQLVCVALAYLCLSYAFAVADFSVTYVATNASRDLPLMYRLSAVWGAHEGSVLLWVLMIAGWS